MSESKRRRQVDRIAKRILGSKRKKPKTKAKIIFERIQSGYLHAESIRICGIFTDEDEFLKAKERIKPADHGNIEVKQIDLNNVSNLFLYTWNHDDDD